ncbi:hypothetical protein ACFV1N_13075 [Streptosporangium canum]|uniref:hypothetical protein n=1 Tax=Streptosporangium canum TaxID=324952 RepID=UPI0036BC5A8F
MPGRRAGGGPCGGAPRRRLDLHDTDAPPRFELANLRLRKDPYGDAYRLCADVLDREEAM